MLGRRTPIDVTCPNGIKVPVNLELQMSSFSGYEGETSTYLGTQCQRRDVARDCLPARRLAYLPAHRRRQGKQ